MKTKVMSILLILAFICSFFLVQPITFAYAQDAEEFQDKHINPVMLLDFNYVEPLVKGDNQTVLHASYRIEFPPLTMKTVNENPNHQVNSFVSDSPSNILQWEYENGEFYQLEHWYNGVITKKLMDKQYLQEKIDSGYYYEGWIPSPNQMADFICYMNGWQLSDITDASRKYECSDGGEIVDLIVESEYPNFQVNSDYDNPEGLVIQQSSMVKGDFLPIPEGKMKTISSSLGMNITQTNIDDVKIEPATLSALTTIVVVLVILAIVAIVCNAWVQTDTTKYGESDMGDAYEDGFNHGVNETMDEYERRLANLLAEGKLPNETYALLRNEMNLAYDKVMSNYENPWDNVEPSGGGNTWVHTIMWVVSTGIIIAVIIIIVVFLLPIVKRIFHKKE